MQNIFNTVQVTRPNYSHFDLSHDHKTSLKMGTLVPCFVAETMPGDLWKMSSEAMYRLMPLVSPIMHRVDCYMHFFFVPNRILWPDWQKFIMGPEDGDQAFVPPAFPILNDTLFYDFEPSSLPDYMGLPLGSVNGSDNISAMPFAAYQRIWHEFYRDENLEPAQPIVLTAGSQDVGQTDALLKLRRRAWEHDYFTSALPWAQKGAPVELPIDIQSADIRSKTAGGEYGAWFPKFIDQASGGIIANEQVATDPSGSFVGQGSNVLGVYDPQGDLYIDEDDFHVTTTINDLRTAYALQRWLEKNARGGSRYVEGLLIHFGVRSSDKTLQRPQYLGGSMSNMVISEVLQTSETDNSPQGNMAGHGISISSGKDFKFYCEEWGFIIGILSIRPKTAYYQGIPRFFSKTIDRLQYPWPDFAFLGEQEILNKEVYYDNSDPTYNEGVFGYIPRYSEYRFLNNRVSGQMRTSLEFWQMGRKFTTPPVLNDEFIQCDPTLRVFANTDPDADTVVAHIFHKVNVRRCLPKYGTPGLI